MTLGMQLIFVVSTAYEIFKSAFCDVFGCRLSLPEFLVVLIQ